MNLREQFEKETEWHKEERHTYAYELSYTEWLEQRNKEQVEVLDECRKSIGAYIHTNTTPGKVYQLGVRTFEKVKEQLKKYE